MSDLLRQFYIKSILNHIFIKANVLHYFINTIRPKYFQEFRLSSLKGLRI